MEKIRYDGIGYRYELQSAGIVKSDWEKRAFYVTPGLIAKIYNETDGKVYFSESRTSNVFEYECGYGDVLAQVRNALTEIAVSKVLKNASLSEIVIDASDLTEEHMRKIDEAMKKVEKQMLSYKIRSKLEEIYSSEKQRFKCAETKDKAYRALSEFAKNHEYFEEAEKAYRQFLQQLEAEDIQTYIRKLEQENEQLKKKIDELKEKLELRKEEIVRELYENDEEITINFESKKTLKVVSVDDE
ncbi:MAG: hypothetical protein QXG39_06380 [Candidatus Aenigmatarchaeota archaeon]